jgi:hypothetical protein
VNGEYTWFTAEEFDLIMSGEIIQWQAEDGTWHDGKCITGAVTFASHQQIVVVQNYDNASPHPRCATINVHPGRIRAKR